MCYENNYGESSRTTSHKQPKASKSTVRKNQPRLANGRFAPPLQSRRQSRW